MTTAPHFLKYAYKASPQLGQLALLGSLIRALGKGWRVCVISDEKEQRIFSVFRQQLADIRAFEILSIKEAEKADFRQFDLVLMENSEMKSSIKSTHLMAIDLQPSDDYDLISEFTETSLQPRGVTAITGNGKGKTTTALGLAAIAMSEGKKVSVIQWFKERKKTGDLTWAINEHEFPAKLADHSMLEFLPTGLGFYGSPKMDRVTGDEAYQQHRLKAYEGLALAHASISSGEYGLVILDELIDTVKEIAQNIEFPLIDLKDLQEFLQFCVGQTTTPIVVTGRRVTSDWEKYISRSIVITEVKHPWSSRHAGAISGLDF